ncbi:MAG: glycosyltransferase [Bacteroidetes bacterium]|uniref:Glycosyltransferase n=1 Tax=Candidatus Cryptobacteroides excrementipullorum TaxID=2840761 RepID=A0A9D9IUW6_9BACT|nr:glycosyltransferase [Candidatus Cryptobacteroides excrementipullorum]
MKKKILFAIHQLDAGGAEKSLISLLNTLPVNELDIDLMVIRPSGLFRNLVPKEVNILETPQELICQNTKITEKLFWKSVNINRLIIKLRCIIYNRFRGNKSRLKMCRKQFYNELWTRYIPNSLKEYDIAVSYIDGLNYYIIDHIKALKKILWCHNDYNKLDYIAEYDYKYYQKANHICTISELCRKVLIDNFPLLKDKFEVIENITSARMIRYQADIFDEISASDDYFKDKRFKIISIGRLAEQKGFDFAIQSAKILKNTGLLFCWYILGEGPLRRSLVEQVKKNKIEDCFKFIGIRLNPYPYIKYADLFVMPSRYEGKSIALDEAKILCKPIVVTKYPSVYDAIDNNKTGILVDINAESITNAIMQLYKNEDLRNLLIRNLEHSDFSNEEQVRNKFLKLIDSCF